MSEITSPSVSGSGTTPQGQGQGQGEGQFETIGGGTIDPVDLAKLKFDLSQRRKEIGFPLALVVVPTRELGVQVAMQVRARARGGGAWKAKLTLFPDVLARGRKRSSTWS